MWSISFEPNSLLFGESCLWLYLWISIPFQYWPNFDQTQSYHVFRRSKWARVLRVILWIKRTWILEKLSLFIVYSVQPIYYGMIVFKFSPMVQESFLMYVNKTNREELAYKVLYSIPITTKFINLIQLIVALVYTSRSHYKEWYTYDYFSKFSLKPMDQLKMMMVTVLITTPDYLRSWLESMFMITFLRSDRYKMFQITLSSAWINALFLFFNLAAATACFIFRYKPVVNIIYSEFCLCKHLKSLRLELLNSYNEPTGKLTATTQNTVNIDPIGTSNSVSRPSDLPSDISTNSNSIRPMTASSCLSYGSTGLKGSPLISELINQRQSVGRPASSRIETNQSAANRRAYFKPRLELPIVEQIHGNASEKKGTSIVIAPELGSCHTISNLFELEKHLTQLYLFVTAMDRQSPSLVFSVIVMNIMLVFHCGLYIREIPPEQLDWHYVFVFCAGPAVPLIALFLVGHLIEFECKQITNLVERIYFEDSSQTLIYKQMKDSQRSLLRIFRLLESTKFTCDELISMNMETFKTVAFYILSALFIVIQYDQLSTFRDDDENKSTAPRLYIGSSGRSLYWKDSRRTNSTYQPRLFD